MMFCTACGATVEDDQLFCTNCGAQIERPEMVQQASAFATQPAGGYPNTPVPTQPVQQQAAADGKGSKRTVLIVGAVIAALAVAAVVGMAVAQVGPFGGGSGSGGTTTVTLGESGDAINEQSQTNIEQAGVLVEDYTGMTLEDATASIEGSGLEVADVTESYSEHVAQGCVMEQGEAAGNRLEKGSSIDLTVSKGPAPHTYTIVEQPMTWAEAKAYCESQGGYLACITSQEENEQVKSLVAGSSCTLFWIGAQRDSGGDFAWVSGEEMSFADWAAGEPNNDGGNENVAAIFQTSNGIAWYDTLNDVSAYYRPTTMAFVMEQVEQ